MFAILNFVLFVLCYSLFGVTCSSVARGGGGGGSSLNFGEDLFFFFLFFSLETACFWAEKTFEFPILAEKSNSISVKTSFFFFFFFFFFFLETTCFWDVWISELSEKFRLNFRTNRVKLIQEQWKFGSGRLHFSHSFKKAPPFQNPGYAPGYMLKLYE